MLKGKPDTRGASLTFANVLTQTAVRQSWKPKGGRLVVDDPVITPFGGYAEGGDEVPAPVTPRLKC